MDDNQAQPPQNPDPDKRDTIRKLVIASAYVVPAIASFSMSEVHVLKAQSYGGNQTVPNP